MEVKSISSYRFNYNLNSPKFTSRNNDAVVNWAEEPGNSSVMKRVPVMVLIAMSPLTSVNTNANEPINFQEPEIEMVQPQNNSGKFKSTLISREKLQSLYETMVFTKIDRDGNKNTTEVYGANYDYLSEGGTYGVMNLNIVGISSKPDKDGRYVILYKEIKRDKSVSELRSCSVQAPFGKHILRFARSKENNMAMFVDDKGNLNNRNYGNIPWIENIITTHYNPYSNEYYEVKK